jgi:tetrapyrrole methylase family protein/MazG family protein
MTQSKEMSDAAERPYKPGLSAIFEVVARLRAPDGCPWDREQTHESLRPYLLEETYELLEAIDAGDDKKIKEELGDVLLQVAMHAEIANEEKRFDAVDVSETVAAKMVIRHPHVFGETSVANADEVLRNWEHQKADDARREGREDESVVDRVPTTLPALAWSLALQKRAARVGFDYVSAKQSAEAVAEEARELAEAADPEAAFDELGDLLLSVVSLARKLKINPEDALRVAGRRFRDRFAALEAQLKAENVSLRDMAPEELQRRWDSTH